MPKPDKMLRNRPLKELDAAVSKLKRVVLFHPKPITELLKPQYCVCKQDEHLEEKNPLAMIQCEECLDWFHFDCVDFPPGADVKSMAWKCE